MSRNRISTVFKINRKIMAELMPSIKEVRCVMNPLDNGISTGAREIYRILVSDNNKQASPDTKVLPIFVNKAIWPRVEVTYVTGAVERWYTHKLPANDILSEMFLHARLAENIKAGMKEVELDLENFDVDEALENSMTDQDARELAKKAQKDAKL